MIVAQQIAITYLEIRGDTRRVAAWARVTLSLQSRYNLARHLGDDLVPKLRRLAAVEEHELQPRRVLLTEPRDEGLRRRHLRQ